MFPAPREHVLSWYGHRIAHDGRLLLQGNDMKRNRRKRSERREKHPALNYDSSPGICGERRGKQRNSAGNVYIRTFLSHINKAFLIFLNFLVFTYSCCQFAEPLVWYNWRESVMKKNWIPITSLEQRIGVKRERKGGQHTRLFSTRNGSLRAKFRCLLKEQFVSALFLSIHAFFSCG